MERAEALTVLAALVDNAGPREVDAWITVLLELGTARPARPMPEVDSPPFGWLQAPKREAA